MSEERPAIAAAVIVDQGRLLLVRRRVTEGSLAWQFPAGEVEPGKDPGAAAVRETAEEVGLIVRVTDRLGERVHPVTGRTMVCTACEVVSGSAVVADAEELDAVAWCAAEEINRRIPAPFYAPVQAYVAARMASAGG